MTTGMDRKDRDRISIQLAFCQQCPQPNPRTKMVLEMTSEQILGLAPEALNPTKWEIQKPQETKATEIVGQCDSMGSLAFVQQKAMPNLREQGENLQKMTLFEEEPSSKRPRVPTATSKDGRGNEPELETGAFGAVFQEARAKLEPRTCLSRIAIGTLSFCWNSTELNLEGRTHKHCRPSVFSPHSNMQAVSHSTVYEC